MLLYLFQNARTVNFCTGRLFSITCFLWWYPVRAGGIWYPVGAAGKDTQEFLGDAENKKTAKFTVLLV